MRAIVSSGLLSVIAVVLTVQGSAWGQGALDGRGFSVLSTNPEEPFPDHLVFAAGAFESMGCRPFGFSATPYTATEEGGVTTFTAQSASPAEGAMSWTGQVAADGSISGSYTWTKEGQDPITAQWAGTTASGPLDGRSFTLIEETGGPEDTVNFALGAFESTGCTQYGFFPVAYQGTSNPDGSIAWTANTYSFTEGMMAWTGSVTGDAIQGSYTWTKEGQDPVTQSFTGTAAAATNPTSSTGD